MLLFAPLVNILLWNTWNILVNEMCSSNNPAFTWRASFAAVYSFSELEKVECAQKSWKNKIFSEKATSNFSRTQQDSNRYMFSFQLRNRMALSWIIFTGPVDSSLKYKDVPGAHCSDRDIRDDLQTSHHGYDLEIFIWTREAGLLPGVGTGGAFPGRQMKLETFARSRRRRDTPRVRRRTPVSGRRRAASSQLQHSAAVTFCPFSHTCFWSASKLPRLIPP